LLPADLADPALMRESRAALEELAGILQLPDLYRDNRAGDFADG
jgi:succinylarginine dihydrolase